MSTDINYENNPLNGVGLKKLLTEIVGHYGFEILFAYLNINCFKTNPSIDSSVKFLKKTDWAREKVEIFYLYEFKNLPKASYDQFSLSPRDRVIPNGQTPGEPAELNLEDAEQLREKRAKKSAERGRDNRRGEGAYNRGNKKARGDTRQRDSFENETVDDDVDPWAKWR